MSRPMWSAKAKLSPLHAEATASAFGRAGGAGKAARRQAARAEFPQERAMPVRAEGMAVRETVATERFVGDDEHSAVGTFLR